MNLNARAEVLAHIRRKGPGWVFTVNDLPPTVDREVAVRVLKHLVRRGRLVRIAPGVFHVPKRLRGLGIVIPPEPEKVARAVARRRGHRITPTGAVAANRLGLTTQVPAKPTYLTDGPSKKVVVGNVTIVLLHAPAKTVRIGGGLERDLVHAIEYIGPRGVDRRVLCQLRTVVPPERRMRVCRTAKRIGGWVGQVLEEVAAPTERETVGNG